MLQVKSGGCSPSGRRLENIKKFISVVEHVGLPSFRVSELEQVFSLLTPERRQEIFYVLNLRTTIDKYGLCTHKLTFYLFIFLFWVQGRISAVVACLLSLRDRFNSDLGEDRDTNMAAKWVIEAKKLEAVDVLQGDNTLSGQQSPLLGDEKRPSLMEAKIQRVLRSPVLSGMAIFWNTCAIVAKGCEHS